MCWAPVGEGARRPTTVGREDGFIGGHARSRSTVLGDEVQNGLSSRVALLSDVEEDRHVVTRLDLDRLNFAVLLFEGGAELAAHLRQLHQIVVCVKDQEGRRTRLHMN